MSISISPFLWFNANAEDAANRYVSLFRESKLRNVSRYGTAGPGPEGSVMAVEFRLANLAFKALNGGPQFTFTPATSFFVDCETDAEVDALWTALADGGVVMMPLDAYPFSVKFGWLQDRFGVSWQINLAGVQQTITPFLMLTQEGHGRAREAIDLYLGTFPESTITHIETYPEGSGEPEGAVLQGLFTLAGQPFRAFDGGRQHAFTFSPAISLFVECETQEEIDEIWNRLSVGGRTNQCGWLDDKFGVTWQVVPAALGRYLSDPDQAKTNRVMEAMFAMSKFDIAGLKAAYDGDAE